MERTLHGSGLSLPFARNVGPVVGQVHPFGVMSGGRFASSIA
jgi:hypothetical protein